MVPGIIVAEGEFTGCAQGIYATGEHNCKQRADIKNKVPIAVFLQIVIMQKTWIFRPIQ